MSVDADPSNAGANSVIGFNVDNTRRMTIKDDGNVGIGTTSPSSKLEVQGATLVSDDGVGDFVKQNVSGTTSTISLGATQA